MNVPSSLSEALADRYRIARELGAGGMATVYLAENLETSAFIHEAAPARLAC